MKRISALLPGITLILIMLAACNGDAGTPVESQNPQIPAGQTSTADDEQSQGEEGPPTYTPPDYNLPDKEADVIRYTEDGKRYIRIGTWYDDYYDSTHAHIHRNPRVENPETAQMELDRVRYVEEKYNVFIELVNMTWDGIMESIPISIMSGIPDCDVYMVDPQFGIPAVLNNMATALEDIDATPAYLDDALATGSNIVMESLKIPGQDKTYLFRATSINQDMYMLGYNRDMLQAKGLEDPQELWYEGLWTWEVFREYCRELTDTANDIYGYSGFWTNFLQHMLFSNDTAFAASPVQTVDSPKTLEVLNFIHELYNVDKTARPWDANDWQINNDLYREGKSGFWITAPWISSQFQDMLDGAPMPFQFGVVPFPIGPSGDTETAATINAAGGNFYFIPRYIMNPGEVFDVMYDYTNWFDYDLEYRDDLEWVKNTLVTEENYQIYMDSVGRYGFDLMTDLGVMPAFEFMLETTAGPAQYTPAQYAETYKQVYQDALDNYFG